MTRILLVLTFFVPLTAEAMRPVSVAAPGLPSAAEANDGHEAVAPVKGPVKLRLRTVDADVEVSVGAGNKITVRVPEGEGHHVAVRQAGGDRYEVLFDGQPTISCGKVCLSVPQKSELDIATDSGDVMVRGVDGEVRLYSAAGDLHVVRANGVEVRSVSGDVAVEEAAGPVRIETVSGDAVVNMVPGAQGKLQFKTTSGDLTWNGACGSGCRLEANSLSGDLAFRFQRGSSFDMRYLSHSGEVSDELGLPLAGARPGGQEVSLQARYGSGDGLVECHTFSGDLRLARAR
jgi:hypothetical protein